MQRELFPIRLSEQAQSFKDNLDRTIRTTEGNIKIIAHFNPDADAVCSALGLQQILRNKYQSLGKTVEVLIDDSRAKDFDLLYEDPDITWVQDGQDTDLLNHCKSEDVLIFVDAGVSRRLIRDRNASQRLEKNFKHIAIIDHHDYTNEEKFETIGLRDEKAYATSEIVARLFDENDDINQNAARLLLVGLYSDSIGYKTFATPRHDVHYVVGNLLARADTTEEELWQVLDIKPDVYEKYVQPLVANQFFRKSDIGMNYSGTYFAQIVSSMMDSYGMRRAYRFFLEDIAGKIQGLNLMWVVYPIGGDGFHISFRSAGPYDVNLLCRDNNTFKFLKNPGGGHFHSASCDIVLSEQEQQRIRLMSADEAMRYVNEIIEIKVVEHFRRNKE